VRISSNEEGRIDLARVPDLKEGKVYMPVFMMDGYRPDVYLIMIRFRKSEVRKILANSIAALKGLHSRGIFHGNTRPSNVNIEVDYYFGGRPGPDVGYHHIVKGTERARWVNFTESKLYTHDSGEMTDWPALLISPMNSCSK
jgi:serine/threonine protein kinase